MKIFTMKEREKAKKQINSVYESTKKHNNITNQGIKKKMHEFTDHSFFSVLLRLLSFNYAILFSGFYSLVLCLVL